MISSPSVSVVKLYAGWVVVLSEIGGIEVGLSQIQESEVKLLFSIHICNDDK